MRSNFARAKGRPGKGGGEREREKRNCPREISRSPRESLAARSSERNADKKRTDEWRDDRLRRALVLFSLSFSLSLSLVFRPVPVFVMLNCGGGIRRRAKPDFLRVPQKMSRGLSRDRAYSRHWVVGPIRKMSIESFDREKKADSTCFCFQKSKQTESPEAKCIFSRDSLEIPPRR